MADAVDERPKCVSNVLRNAMNSMWLDTDLRQAADWHFKEHQKLILEAGQMLSTALNEHGLEDVAWYGSTHTNHPLTIWTRTSSANWFKMREYMSALHESFYGYSYDGLRRSYERGADLDRMDDEGDIHATFKKVVKAHPDSIVELVLPDVGLTARPKCVGGIEWDATESVEEVYRRYYAEAKAPQSDKFTWREVPEWA